MRRWRARSLAKSEAESSGRADSLEDLDIGIGFVSVVADGGREDFYRS
jgi:hypothetical protein